MNMTAFSSLTRKTFLRASVFRSFVPLSLRNRVLAQKKFWQLKLIEFGGRPTFYFYSKFKDDGKNWMGDGDLGCATDDELRGSVSKIKEGADIYAKLSHLQFEFMEEHEEPADGVWRMTYSNGARVYVNYG